MKITFIQKIPKCSNIIIMPNFTPSPYHTDNLLTLSFVFSNLRKNLKKTQIPIHSFLLLDSKNE